MNSKIPVLLRGSSPLKSLLLRLSLAALLVPVCLGRAGAAPADDDPTFGDKGFLRAGWLTSAHMQVLPDDKILLSAVANENGQERVVLKRFTPDGQSDTSFGTNGQVTTGLAGARQLLVSKEGRILVLSSEGITRFDEKGSKDTSWGQQGLASVEGGINMGLQPDGGVVVLCNPDRNKREEPRRKAFVERVNPQGVRDTDFGQVTRPEAERLFVNSQDGSFVLGGTTDLDLGLKVEITGDDLFTYQLSFWRYQPNGKLDTRFGNGGKTDWSNDTVQHTLGNIVFLPDNSFVVIAGSAPYMTHWGYPGRADMYSQDLAMIHVLANGKVDAAWGASAGGALDFGGNENLYDASAIRLLNGSILVRVHYSPDVRIDRNFRAGTSDFVASYNKSVEKYNADREELKGRWKYLMVLISPRGQLDSSFSVNRQPVTVIIPNSAAVELGMQSNGKILILGADNEKQSIPNTETTLNPVWVRRLNGYPAGALQAVTGFKPEGEEIQLEGTLSALAGNAWTLRATAFALPNGNRKALQPKAKTITFAANTKFVNGTSLKPIPRTAFKPGTKVAVIGTQAKNGQSFTARAVLLK